jgi:hypothetical protein
MRVSIEIHSASLRAHDEPYEPGRVFDWRHDYGWIVHGNFYQDGGVQISGLRGSMSPEIRTATRAALREIGADYALWYHLENGVFRPVRFKV